MLPIFWRPHGKGLKFGAAASSPPVPTQAPGVRVPVSRLRAPVLRLQAPGSGETVSERFYPPIRLARTYRQ